MEFNFTQLIEKTLKNFIGGKRGEQISKIYMAYWNPINYAIVGGIGVLLNYLIWATLNNAFDWWITNAMAIIVTWGWNWIMSVGPLGYMWGFKTQKNVSKQSKDGWKQCTRKPTALEYREVKGEKEVIKTLNGTVVATKEDYIIRGVQGEEYPIKKEIFNQTYKTKEGNKL